MSWRVAASLDVLLAEVNNAAPNRSKISDGSIGDAAHATRDSDHNPWVVHRGIGVVRARDFTHDPGNGCDAAALAENIRRLGVLGHPALGPGAYVISNRRIASATPDGRTWDWEPYGGSNPHERHCHVSVALDPDGFDSPRPWNVMGRPQEDDMQLDDKISGHPKAVTVGQVLAEMHRFVEDSSRRERRMMRMLNGIPEEVAATVAREIGGVGAGVTEADVRRIVYAQARRAIDSRLGSLDEPDAS